MRVGSGARLHVAMAERDPYGAEDPEGPELDTADEPTLRELEEVTVKLELLVDRIEQLADGISRAVDRPSPRS